MSRLRLSAIAALASFGLPALAQQPIFLEESTYRSGGTYASYFANDAYECARICAADRSCKSFSFVLYGPNTPAMRCEVKAAVGVAQTNPNAISGISPAIEALYQHPVPVETAPAQIQDELLGGSSSGRNVRTSVAPQSQPREPGMRRVPVATYTRGMIAQTELPGRGLQGGAAVTAEAAMGQTAYPDYIARETESGSTRQPRSMSVEDARRTRASADGS